MEFFAIAFLTGQLPLLALAVTLNRAATRNWLESLQRPHNWKSVESPAKNGAVGQTNYANARTDNDSRQAA